MEIHEPRQNVSARARVDGTVSCHRFGTLHPDRSADLAEMQVRSGLRRGRQAGDGRDRDSQGCAGAGVSDPQRLATTCNDLQRSVPSEGRAGDPVQYPSDGERPSHPKRSQ